MSDAERTSFTFVYDQLVNARMAQVELVRAGLRPGHARVWKGADETTHLLVVEPIGLSRAEMRVIAERNGGRDAGEGFTAGAGETPAQHARRDFPADRPPA